MRISKFINTAIGIQDFNQVKKLIDDHFISILDIGAAGGIERRWKKYSPLLDYIGAEPNSFNKHTIPNEIFHQYEVIPYGIAEENKISTLFVTRDTRKSSIYEPNLDFIKKFPRYDRFDIIEKDEIEFFNIDSFISRDIDFIKLDIQGGESKAIEGAEKTLSAVLGLEVEVEFLQVYLNQPLYSSINNLLCEFNFEFIDFVNLCRWERDSISGAGQLVSGDALYLKTPEIVINSDSSSAEIRKYLAILFIYNRFDLIERSFSIRPKLKYSFKSFYRYQKRKRKMLRFIFLINRIISVFYSFLGQEIRSHVVY